MTAAMASKVKDVFTEVVVAPDFEDEALSILKGKKNIRILRLPTEDAIRATSMETRPVRAAHAGGRPGRCRRARRDRRGDRW